MRIGITSTGNQVTSKFDPFFGKAVWFCIYDTERHTIDFIPNNFRDMNSGSGTKSSEMLAELRVEQIISGDFGERARERLKKMNIKTLQWEDTRKSVREIIDKIS